MTTLPFRRPGPRDAGRLPGVAGVRAIWASLVDDFTGRPPVSGRGRRLLWRMVRTAGRVCR
ncbi:hypothetical protein ABZV91_16205 [Nocardia sp. NPDC004568]|uniref:hypothetical protein n=1 Tax=Nocardia sp. NPDC004568 TaxID=3154551 RepID=UPI0033B7A85A